MYLHRSTLGPVDLAFTDRFGGVSAVPYDELNLALEGGDDPVARETNLGRVVTDFGGSDFLVQMRQVHGTHVDMVEDRRSSGHPDADAMVTAQPGVVLLVRAADCVPLVLADPEAEVIAVVHAGRLGMADGVVPATVAKMQGWGARRITAWIGPHICGRCYEVPEEMREAVGDRVPEAIATTSWGTPSLDLGAGIAAQLEADDVEIAFRGPCTLETQALYSYRRDGAAAGRHAGLVRLRR